MGLFNNLMPGESYGIPTQSQGGMQGLLSDPLLNIGLGILANNNNRNLGQVLGRGALSGLQNVQQQQQLEQQRKMQDAQTQEYERRQKEFDREQKAIEDFKVKFPEYAGAVDLDPKAAIKAAYPNVAANAVDPYFTPIPTEQGLGRFNARTGQFELLTDPSGKPIIKSTDSPLIRGAVRQAEAGGTAAYNIDTSIPGVVTTAKQVAEQANPSLVQPQQPIPQIPQGTPMLPQGAPQVATPQAMRVPAPVQRQRDDMRMKILLDEQRSGGGPGVNPELDKEIARMGGGQVLPTGGIKVPTAAELAADKKAAEDAAEYNSPENLRKREQAYKFKTTTGKAVLDTIDDASKRVNNWTAGLGGSSLRGIPASDAYDLNSDIETIKANFGFDRLQAMRDMSPTGGALGGIAVQELSALQASVANLDTAQSPKQLKKNLDKAKMHYKNWLDTLEETKKSQDGAIIPKDEAMPAVKALALPAKPSALTLKKGQVYSTPKGNLRWNGKAFED
jgi:hypothetical protein